MMINVVYNIVSFSLFSNNTVQTWMKKHVFGKMEGL